MADARYRLRCGAGTGNTNPYLIFYIGQWQLYNPVSATVLTFAQGLARGGFSEATPNGSYIHAMGPGTDRQVVDVGYKVFSDSSFATRACLWMSWGQSTDGAATPGIPDDPSQVSDPTLPYLTHQPPLPLIVFCSLNGTQASPDGPSAPAADTVWPPVVYEGPLVPMKAAINTIRNPGRDIDRQTPGITAATGLGRALPAGGQVHLVEGFAGSRTMRDVLGGFSVVVSATYDVATQTATYVCSSTVNVAVGDNFGSGYNELTGISPAGYQTGGPVTSVTTSGGVLKVIKVSMPVNPGATSATVTDGTFLDWGNPGKSMIAFATYWKDNLVPGGLTPWMLGGHLIGHESAASVGTIAGGLSTIHDFSRRFLNHVRTLVNPAQVTNPAFIHLQNNTPRFDFADTPQRIGEVSVSCCLMQEYVIRNALDSMFATMPTFMMESGGGVQVSSPHYDMPGNPAAGSLIAHAAIELWNGTYTAPTLNDDFTLLLETPTVITGTSSVSLEVDNVEVLDPNGHGGMQAFNLDIGSVGLLNRFSLEQPDFRNGTVGDNALASVALSTTNLTITAGASLNPINLFVAAGFKFPRAQIKPPVNVALVAASWVDGIGTMTFSGSYDAAEGELARVYQVNQTDWNNLTPGWTVQPGSTSTVLKVIMPNAPVPWDGLTGRCVRIGNYSVGRTFGNAHNYCAKETPGQPRYWNFETGEWLRQRLLVPKPRLVFARSSNKFLVEQRSAMVSLVPGFANTIKTVFDFADDRTTNVADTAAIAAAHDALGDTTADFSTNTAMTLSGTHNSGSRLTFALAGANGNFKGSVSNPIWQNAWKRAWGWGGVVSGRHKTGANAQYWGATSAGESTQAEGNFFRVSAGGIPTFGTRGVAGANVWSQTVSGVTWADGHDFTIEFWFQDGVDASHPGWGFVRADGVLAWEGQVSYSNPSTAASSQSPFCMGINGTTGSRRWVAGSRLYFAAFGQGQSGPYDESYFRAMSNSWERRAGQDAY